MTRFLALVIVAALALLALVVFWPVKNVGGPSKASQVAQSQRLRWERQLKDALQKASITSTRSEAKALLAQLALQEPRIGRPLLAVGHLHAQDNETTKAADSFKQYIQQLEEYKRAPRNRFDWQAKLQERYAANAYDWFVMYAVFTVSGQTKEARIALMEGLRQQTVDSTVTYSDTSEPPSPSEEGLLAYEAAMWLMSNGDPYERRFYNKDGKALMQSVSRRHGLSTKTRAAVLSALGAGQPNPSKQ